MFNIHGRHYTAVCPHYGEKVNRNSGLDWNKTPSLSFAARIVGKNTLASEIETEICKFSSELHNSRTFFAKFEAWTMFVCFAGSSKAETNWILSLETNILNGFSYHVCEQRKLVACIFDLYSIYYLPLFMYVWETDNMLHKLLYWTKVELFAIGIRAIAS